LSLTNKTEESTLYRM